MSCLTALSGAGAFVAGCCARTLPLVTRPTPRVTPSVVFRPDRPTMYALGGGLAIFLRKVVQRLAVMAAPTYSPPAARSHHQRGQCTPQFFRLTPSCGSGLACTHEDNSESTSDGAAYPRLSGHRRNYGLRFLGCGLLLSSPRSDPDTTDQFRAGAGGFQPSEVLARGVIH